VIRARRQAGGFALVAALFLLIVVATLGAFAVQINSSQLAGADLELATVRAEAALDAGIQYAAARLLATNNCNSLSGLLPQPPLSLPQNFSVAFSACQQLPNPVANTPAVTVFSVSAIATRGQYGSPDFVSRQRTVRITTP
jgi:MSHA biogenesis protein MshP